MAKTKQEQVKHEEKYIAFLEKQLASDNYKSNVTKAEYEKTQTKHKKAKLRLQILLGKWPK